MTATTLELIEAPVEAEDDRPNVAHVYCKPCNTGHELWASMCGCHQEPSRQMGHDWPAEAQRCVVCAEMIDEPCPRCGT